MPTTSDISNLEKHLEKDTVGKKIVKVNYDEELGVLALRLDNGKTLIISTQVVALAEDQ